MSGRPLSAQRTPMQLHFPPDIDAFIPESEWMIYRAALRAARSEGVAFAASGGLAMSFYTGFWRNTKDLDLVVLPRTRDAMIRATLAAGLADYFDELPYDRSWIYRAVRDGVIVDAIWALANGAGEVDEAWLELGPVVEIRGERIPLVPPEEMIWSKIHIVQRERCDWPDVMNMLYVTGPSLDWSRLMARMAGDEELLAAVVRLFSWLAPGRAAALPAAVFRQLGIRRPASGAPVDRRRVALLDSRPWFSPVPPA